MEILSLMSKNTFTDPRPCETVIKLTHFTLCEGRRCSGRQYGNDRNLNHRPMGARAWGAPKATLQCGPLQEEAK